jgi:hypothetical protein
LESYMHNTVASPNRSCVRSLLSTISAALSKRLGVLTRKPFIFNSGPFPIGRNTPGHYPAQQTSMTGHARVVQERNWARKLHVLLISNMFVRKEKKCKRPGIICEGLISERKKTKCSKSWQLVVSSTSRGSGRSGLREGGSR